MTEKRVEMTKNGGYSKLSIMKKGVAHMGHLGGGSPKSIA
jgi:hypothetical protein